MRGYYGIGIENTKNIINVGTLWRSANAMGASFVFTIGKRYKHQSSDTTKAWKHVPFYQYKDFDEFYSNLPKDCFLVGVELNEGGNQLSSFIHPERAVYLLGAEDSGLSPTALKRCHRLVEIDSTRCLNVSVSGSIVMYDRRAKCNLNKK